MTAQLVWFRWFGGLFLALSLAAHAEQAFQLGIAPHTSARKILEMYQPLRVHLEKALGRPVEVVTAPDFTDFARRMLHQDYDLAVTTGHQARLAETDANYLPLVTYRAEFKAVAVVASNGPIHTPADLHDQPMLGLSPTSLVTLWGQHWMKQQGLTQTLRYVSASDSVANIVISGQAAAGFTSLANYQSFTPEVQAQLRVLVESEEMAGRVYLLNVRQQALKARIAAALQSFSQSEEGKAYFARYQLQGYRVLQPNELKAMDAYAAEVRQSLK